MRAEKNGLAGQNWFNRVLTSTSGKTFANEYNCRDRVPILKLTCAVQENTIRRRRGPGSQFSPQAHAQPEPCEARADFGYTFDVTWCDDEREPRKAGPKSLENFTEDGFFAGMRASAKENR